MCKMKKVIVTKVRRHMEMKRTLSLVLAFVIGSWSSSGINRVTVSGSCAVTDGLEYRQVTTGTIDDVPFTNAEIVGTC